MAIKRPPPTALLPLGIYLLIGLFWFGVAMSSLWRTSIGAPIAGLMIFYYEFARSSLVRGLSDSMNLDLSYSIVRR